MPWPTDPPTSVSERTPRRAGNGGQSRRAALARPPVDLCASEAPLRVGARLFIGEALYATEDGATRGDRVGRTYIECTADISPFTFRCDASFVVTEGSQLHATVLIGADVRGQARGRTVLLNADGELQPAWLTALTVNRWSWPLASPVTVSDRAPASTVVVLTRVVPRYVRTT